jgi:hypothetical protein
MRLIHLAQQQYGAEAVRIKISDEQSTNAGKHKKSDSKVIDDRFI